MLWWGSSAAQRDGRRGKPLPYGFSETVLDLVGEPLGAPAANESVSLARKPRRSRETAPATIFARPGPSGPVEISDRHSDFARRKCCKIQQVRVPRNGVRGKATMSTKCSSGAVPGGVLVTLPPRAKSLAARRRRNLLRICYKIQGGDHPRTNPKFSSTARAA